MDNPKPPIQKKRTSLGMGALLNWMNLGIHVVSAFLITPIIIRQLGAADFGMWALIQSFSGYYGLVNLGFGSALLKSITQDLSIQNWPSLQKTISTALTFFGLTGAVILTLAGTLAWPLAPVFRITPENAPIFALTTFVAACAIVSDFSGAIKTCVVTANERFDILNYLNMGRQLVQTVGILLVLWLKPSILGVACVILATSLIALYLTTFFAKRLVPEVRFRYRGFDKGRLKELLTYGGSTVLLSISNIVRLRVGNMVIAMTSGVAAVAGYSIAVSLITNFTQLISSSTNVLSPRFTRLNALENTEELKKLYRSALLVSAALSFGIGSSMLLFGEKFILMWVGKSVSESVPIMNVLVVAYTVALAQAPSWNMMFALAKHHYMARVSLIEAILNIGLGLWLSKIYGPIGFAWATLLVMFFAKILLQVPYSAQIAGLSLREYLEPMFAPAACAILLLGLSKLVHVDAFLVDKNLFIFVCTGILYLSIYVTLVCLLVKNKNYAPSFLNKVFSYFKRVNRFA